jgi:enamine deaminase RidA (YjgF/YER057c/UK114 family)
MKVEKTLQELGLELPEPSKPIGSYVPWIISGNLLFISGTIPSQNGVPRTGKFGDNLKLEDAEKLGKIVALTLIANTKDAIKDLDKVKRIVEIEGFVNSTPDFIDQPKVINEVSNLLVKIFGEKGKHSRIAIGVNSLPLGAAIEVSAIIEIEKLLNKNH